MLAQGPFSIEGRCSAVDRVRSLHHLVELGNRPAHLIAHLVEIVCLGELAEQPGDVAGYIGVVQSQLAFVTVADCLLKERFERMTLRLHTDLLWPCTSSNRLLLIGCSCAL